MRELRIVSTDAGPGLSDVLTVTPWPRKQRAVTLRVQEDYGDDAPWAAEIALPVEDVRQLRDYLTEFLDEEPG